MTLEEMAKQVNQVVRGWFGYYGRYYPSWLQFTLRRVNESLVRWAMRKYKKLRGHPKRAQEPRRNSQERTSSLIDDSAARSKAFLPMV